MSRYFFHLCNDDGVLLDTEGREFVDRTGIPEAALAEVRAIIGAEALEGAIDLRQWLDIVDAQGAVAYRLAFRDAVAIRP